MIKSQAQLSILNLNQESFSLTPSSLVTLFEIDVSQIGYNQGIITTTEINQQNNTIFRFHNMNKLGSSSIWWNNNEYIMVPIQAQGFEITSKGALPVPKLSISVSDQGVPILSALKTRMNELGDLIGTKLTRRRTFAKYIDAVNFLDNTTPQGFAPDPNCEFPNDIYYIDRKSGENKNYIEYELVSSFDMENIRLPGRVVYTTACGAFYRGESCLYEFALRKNAAVHGPNAILPNIAPPVATVNDESISTLLGDNIPYTDRGRYNTQLAYNIGDTVFIQYKGLNYYFVSKVNNNLIS